MTWELKPGAAPDNAHYQGNTNVNGEDMTEIEENMLLPISAKPQFYGCEKDDPPLVALIQIWIL